MAARPFFDQLADHCGNAYPGGLTLEPEGDEMLTGTEILIVHFGAGELKLYPATATRTELSGEMSCPGGLILI